MRCNFVRSSMTIPKPEKIIIGVREMKVYIAENLSCTAHADQYDKLITFGRTPDSDDSISLLDLVEENDAFYRSRYLRIIYNLSKEIVAGHSLAAKGGRGLNFWWLSRVFESCNYASSPYIETAIQLLALEDYLVLIGAKQVCYGGSSDMNGRAVQQICKSIGIRFFTQNNRVDTTSLRCRALGYPRVVLKWFSARFKVALRGVAEVLRGYLVGIAFRVFTPASKAKPSVDFIFLDIQSHFSSSENKSTLKSRYWGDLQRLLHAQNIKVEFLQLFTRSKSSPSFIKLVRDVRAQAKTATPYQSHSIVQSHVRFLDLFRVIYRCIRIRREMVAVIAIGSKNLGYIWPLIRRDFFTSFSWAYLASILWKEIYFSNAARKYSGVRAVFFPQEGQAWEHSLTFEFRSYCGSAKIIGVPHVASKFWDLRHWYSSEFFDREELGVPFVDHIVVNSKAARQLYIDASVPSDMLFEAEALRFLARENVAKGLPCHGENKRVLVAGDLLDDNTRVLLDLVSDIQEAFPEKLQIIYKAHPNSAFDTSKYDGRLDISISTEQIVDLAARSKVTFASNRTTAGVEAYVAGSHVFIALDAAKLNSSPLRGVRGVMFCNGVSAETLRSVRSALNESTPLVKRQFFFDDRSLPRWQRFLASF